MIVDLGTPLIVPIEIMVAFAAGVDTATLRGQMQASVFEFVNSLGVNDVLSRPDLFTVLSRFKSAGAIVRQDSIVRPAGDLVPPVGQTIRTLLPLVAIN